MDFTRVYDVLVLGGGNAGLCAAITAREAGASVAIVDAAPKHLRGGNSRHTRNMRTMHTAPVGPMTDAYPEEEYWDDLLKVTGGLTDEALARRAIRQTDNRKPPTAFYPTSSFARRSSERIYAMLYASASR